MKSLKIKAKDYQKLFTENRKLFSKGYLIYYGWHSSLVVKTAAKKKIGRAVERNFLKRRLKEVIREVNCEIGLENLLILAIIVRKPDLTYGQEKDCIKKMVCSIHRKVNYKSSEPFSNESRRQIS